MKGLIEYYHMIWGALFLLLKQTTVKKGHLTFCLLLMRIISKGHLKISHIGDLASKKPFKKFTKTIISHFVDCIQIPKTFLFLSVSLAVFRMCCKLNFEVI